MIDVVEGIITISEGAQTMVELVAKLVGWTGRSSCDTKADDYGKILEVKSFNRYITQTTCN